MEGSGAVRLINLMKKHGYNKDLSVSLATVTNGMPDIRIQVDGMKIELDKDDLVIAERVKDLTTGDRVIVVSDNDQTFYVLDRAVIA
jgi:hypothetical protein